MNQLADLPVQFGSLENLIKGRTIEMKYEKDQQKAEELYGKLTQKN